VNIEDVLYPLLKRYERLPRGIKASVGSTYRRLPRRVRLGARYEEFCKLATRAESWSAEQADTYQFHELRKVLLHAEAYSPFYSRRFSEAGFHPSRMTSFEDLASCPYTSRTDLADHLDVMATTKPSRFSRLYVATSGTSGTPVGIYLHKGVSRPKEQAFLEAQWRRAGYFDGARLAVLRGRVVSASPQGPIATYDGTRDYLILSSWHLSAERLPEYLDEIARFRPDILNAYPSAALQLAEYLDRTGEKWPVPLRCVLAGSERFTLPQKRLLERTFGCRVYTWYGQTERVVLAGEGRSSGLLYFWPAYGYVEFGPPDQNGLQEVIGTSFHNLAMPLIRYRTGDYVQVHDPSTDGPKEFDWPAITSVDGREQEFIVTAAGRRISVTGLNMHDRCYENLYAIQFFQERPGYVELRYVPSPDFDRSRLPGIDLALRRKLGDEIHLVLREVDQIEKTDRGKGKWLVSTLPDDSTDANAPVDAHTLTPLPPTLP